MYDLDSVIDEALTSRYEDSNGDPDLDLDTSDLGMEYDEEIDDCWQYYPSDDNAWIAANPWTSADDPATDWSRE